MGENYFNDLNSINVNGKVEQKNGLSYLSWAFAWGEVKKVHPDAEYKIKKFGEAQLPYVYDEKTGYMVYTDVTINGITHEMWLPVMDGANKAMKDKPYEYTSGFGQYAKKKTVEAATMFDINKTIMRCLTKNLAMHGLGLYIYAGEDLPESVDGNDDQPSVSEPKNVEEEPISQADRQLLFKTARDAYGKDEGNEVIKKILASYGLETTNGMKKGMFDNVMNALLNSKEAAKE